MSNSRVLRYRRLALASDNKVDAELLLNSQMNAIRDFSAPLNGFRRGHTTHLRSRPKQQPAECCLSGSHSGTEAPCTIPGRPVWTMIC